MAVSVFITLSALALQQYPECRPALEADNGDFREWFVQEVRRFYPFFPAVRALVRDDFQWRGIVFPRGRRVLLDLYGTKHDPDIWKEPGVFQPERFQNWNESPYSFIPQGGGDHYQNHRCPGEWITIELMKAAVDFLTRDISYEIPDQDLEIDFSRMPALSKSKFIIGIVLLRG